MYDDEDDRPVLKLSRESEHVASRDYRCNECGTTIEAGSRYQRFVSITDDGVFTTRVHVSPRCTYSGEPE